MSGSVAGVLLAVAAAAAGGGNIVLGTPVQGTILTNSAIPTVTFTGTAGGGAVIGVWFFDGASARTLSTAVCSSLETVNQFSGSRIQGTSGCHLEFLTIDNFTASGSKTVSVTFSGASDETFLLAWPFTGQVASGAIGGGVNAGGSAFATPAQISLTAGASGSAVFGICHGNMSVLTPGSGFTGQTISPGMASGFANAEYEVTVGSAGSKTVGFAGATGGVWAISAIEIKSS